MQCPSLLARALLAYSVHEHQEGFVRRIDLWQEPDGFTVEDDGRGMGLHRAGYVENLMGTLAGGPGPVQLHGVGLSLVSASVPLLEVRSRREGRLYRQAFAWGAPQGPVTSEPGDARTGTRMRIVLPEGAPPVRTAGLDAQIGLWRERHPALAIVVHEAAGRPSLA